jgi:hypothetical protein
MCFCLLQIGPPIEMSINILHKLQQLNNELAAWDVNYTVSNRKLNTYECRLYLMHFCLMVADGNLNQGVKAWLSLGDVLRETPVSVKQ